jgi:hypothetical protein
MVNVYVNALLVLQDVTDAVSGVVEPLAQNHPLLGVIATIGVAVVGYLVVQLRSKEAELRELNQYVRENDRENLRTIQGLATMIDQVVANTGRIPADVKRDLDATAEKILLNLTSAIERIRNHGE